MSGVAGTEGYGVVPLTGLTVHSRGGGGTVGVLGSSWWTSRALRDLLVISGWNREHVGMISVHHPSDTHPTASGQELPWWRPVVSADVSVGDRSRTRNHLITWADLGVDGIRRWFWLRER